MSFRFRHSTLLRIREIAEDKEERLLAQILNNMSAVRLDLSALKQQQVDLLVHREQEMKRRMSAAELQSSYARKRALEEEEHRLQERLTQFELLRRQQMLALEKAHRDHEALDALREKDLEAFREEQTHREQQRMDDNFSARRRPTRH